MKRLDLIRSLIDPGKGVIDVGTDHGFLPIMLALDGFRGNLIASDIHRMPLCAAERNAQNQGVSDRISFRLGDGLDICSADEVDTIVLAGMGGDLICSILDRAEWTMSASQHLILQPMTKAEILRYWLCCNGYSIEKEYLACEKGRIFQILSVRFQDRNTPMRDAELFLGKQELISGDPLFQEELTQVITHLGKKTDGLLQAGAGSSPECRFYQRILEELRVFLR